MRSILKGSGALAAMLLLAVSTAASAYNKIEKPLYAGQHILVGKLVVEQFKKTEGNRTVKYLRVTYDTTSSNWGMTTTHLYVSKNKPRRAAPGRFPFKHEGLDNVKIDVYEVPLSQLLCSDQYLYIAAHAEVCEEAECVPDFAAMAAALPQDCVPTLWQSSYPDANLLGTPSSGLSQFLSWCVDASVDIGLGNTYCTKYYLSVLPDGSVNPLAEAVLPPMYAPAEITVGSTTYAIASRIPYLNYILNQQYSFASGVDYVTADVIQLAIWVITNGRQYVEENWVPPSEPVWVLINGVLADALTNGANYTPGCGANVAILAEPITATNGRVQPSAFGTTVLGQSSGTGDCETAWAKGNMRFRTGWGSYFTYQVK